MAKAPRFTATFLDVSRIICVVGLNVFFVACGGGGSPSAPSDNESGSVLGPPQEVTLSFQATKVFRFDWGDAQGATHYKLLENPGGMSGFTQVGGDIGAGGSNRLFLEVPLFARINAQYILQACNATDCVDSDTLSVSGHLVGSIGYFKASNTNPSDFFGDAVSLSADGRTLAVGADFEDSNATGINGNHADNSASEAGAVYVYARADDTGAWALQAYLKASNTDARDHFGADVSLSADGHTLAVGAYGEASNATGVNDNELDNTASGAGAVYVFVRAGSGTWAQQAYLKASNTDPGDAFGSNLSLSSDGHTLAVGAPGERSINGNQANNSASEVGAVYVFNRSEAGSWVQQAYLKASNASQADVFGKAVSLSGDGETLVAGAHRESSNATGINGNEVDDSATHAGAVYVFVRGDAGSWAQQAYLKASNTGAYDNFGISVSVSADGRTLAVGAILESSNAAGIGGNEVDNSAIDAGAVYVFSRAEVGAWAQQAYLKASNGDAYRYFGRAVSLSGSGEALVVGSTLEGSGARGINGNEVDNSANNAGAAYVFRRSAGAWVQQAYVKASNTGAGDFFGAAVSLSSDGRTLAVGAGGEDSRATLVNGNQDDNWAAQAGSVYLF